ncbi:response regulator transcription factor [Prevotella koreensis]
MERLKLAIIDSNTLSVLGLKHILQNVMPIVKVESFYSFEEFEAQEPEQFAHLFVAMNIVLDNRTFFLEQVRRTIVLTTSQDSQMSGFKCICINVPEKQLIRSLLVMHSGGHPKGAHLPQLPECLSRQILTNRELEVMSLIVQGFINKEIADKLNIGLTTVITHRKNIMDKLGLKSVSALTIYAVMHGYVDISKI